MKNLFSLENPFIRFLSRVADLVVLQVLFILFSLPVITIGASITAMAKVTQAIIREEDSAIVRPFVDAFKDNFRRATPAWLGAMLALGGIVCDFLLLKVFVSGVAFTILSILLLVLLVVVVGILSYLFPLIARYENTLRQHLQNAMVLFLLKFPKTLLMVFLNLSYVIMIFMFPSVLIYTMIFWIFAGFSFLSYMISYVLKPVFDSLEK